MKLSRDTLLAESQATGFRPEVQEKACHLLNLLNGFRSHPFLRGKFAIKGGTALNLFLFDVPRLSVDIDLNYVGSVDRDGMQRDRPGFEKAIEAVCAREDMTITRVPTEHAGGKWRLRYSSGMGQDANLELDLNYLLRVPLWPVTDRDSRSVGSISAQSIPTLDIHELAAGKLAALCARKASRDLFDAHALLTDTNLDQDKLRLGFVVYGGFNRKDWRSVAIDDIAFEARELKNRLIPVLRRMDALAIGDPDAFAEKLVEETRDALRVVLPLRENEVEFLNCLLDQGEVLPDLLTGDSDMATKIESHPALAWKAQNVRKHKGTSK